MPGNARVSEKSFPDNHTKLSTPKMGNFSGISKIVSQTVSQGISKCGSCGALVNERWERCLVCKKALLDVPGNPVHARSIEPSNTSNATHLEMAAKRKPSSDLANRSPANESAWTGETATHAQWFLAAEPPTEPFILNQGVTVARPGPFWQHLRTDVLAGPLGPRAYYGAIQDYLRCLYERFVDTDPEREAIIAIDGGNCD